jgi:AmmeMemoRadiSam system protein B
MTGPNIRKAYFADKVYPSDPVVLSEIINQVTPAEILHPEKTLRVLHVPHIDYMRGIEIYGAGYQSLRNQNYDVIFLLGTSHQFSESFCIFTEDEFDSPFGVVKTHFDINSRLIDAYGRPRALSEKDLHKTEHSLELQIPFIKYLLPNTPVVPLLIGSIHHLFPSGDRFAFEPYRKLVEVLVDETNRLDSLGKKYLFLAGVDMAHVGRFFGDSDSLNNDKLYQIASLDRQYLEFIESLDSESLFKQIAHDGDSRRVCGFSTMMIITDVLKLRSEKNIQALNACYKPCFDSASDCCVTISGVGYYID